MSPKDDDGAQQQQQANSFYAALARTATRSLALYFSRPVRLFRPSKGASSRPGSSTQALTKLRRPFLPLSSLFDASS